MWQHCSLTAVQRKTAFVEESWWPEFNLFGCHGVRSHGTSSSQGWRKRIVIQSTVYIWSMSLHLHTFTCVFSTNLIYVGLPRKAFPGKQAKVDTGHQCFSVVAQANGYFQMKELDRTTEPIARTNVEWKLEKAGFAEFNLPTCGNIAVWQLCRERQPSWKSHDGLNLTCLDQCHGVRSLGTSSSQGWRKLIVIRHSKDDPWVYIRVFNQPALCRFA